jgi:hypothetical protein
MALIKTFVSTLGCASLLVSLPMLAVANQDADTVEATHFVSSGRIVNVVADVTPTAQADARAAIWALTQQADAPTCESSGVANADCFETFQTGSN